MLRCTRPEWSEADNDYCPCDNNVEFNAALQSRENPCYECTWYKETPWEDE